MYDRESNALERLHDQPDVRPLDELAVDMLANVVDPPVPWPTSVAGQDHTRWFSLGVAMRLSASTRRPA